MATELPNELEVFRQFVNTKIDGGAEGSVDDLLEDFRQYQREFANLQGKLKQAALESEHGESRELDLAELKAEVTRRLAEKGITD